MYVQMPDSEGAHTTGGERLFTRRARPSERGRRAETHSCVRELDL